MPTPDQLREMDPEAFERFVGRLLELRGFSNVLHLGGTGDEGVDLRAEWLMELPTGGHRSTVWAVQCKRYKANLSQGHIQEILAAAIEPSPDIFSTPIDFFLLATSSALTASAIRLVERANGQRQKYSCSFVVWDADEICKLASEHAETERFFERPLPSLDTSLVSRLTVYAERGPEETSVTFFYEGPGRGPSCSVESTALANLEFEALVEQFRILRRSPPLSGLGRPSARRDLSTRGA